MSPNLSVPQFGRWTFDAFSSSSSSWQSAAALQGDTPSSGEPIWFPWQSSPFLGSQHPLLAGCEDAEA